MNFRTCHETKYRGDDHQQGVAIAKRGNEDGNTGYQHADIVQHETIHVLQISQHSGQYSTDRVCYTCKHINSEVANMCFFLIKC